MSEIKYKEFAQYLKDREKEPFAPIYLIYGEEFVYKTVFEKLLKAMLPDSKKSLNYEPVDGTSGDIFDVIEHINTYSFLSNLKVVSLTDSRIFYSKQDGDKYIEKAKDAFEKNDFKRAAKQLVDLLSLLNLSLSDLGKETRKKALKEYQDRLGDDSWLDTLISYCEDQGVSIPAWQDHATILQTAIEKGFPKGNHLIITTDLVDKRRRLYKAIKKNGSIIDCSVSKSSRQADKKVQEALLFERMGAILAKTGKSIDRGTFQVMCEMTGFDLRTFSGNMEKLIDYVGARETIHIDDVHAVVKRTKQDPIYELTNALADKVVENALFYIESLLSSNFHPLQILTAIANHIRRLLVIKDFSESTYGDAWKKSMSYKQFTRITMPAIQAYDKEIIEQLKNWEQKLSEVNKITKKDGKHAGPETDIVIAKNPNNPYPLYQMLLKSENFTKEELIDAFETLGQADLRMKSVGRNPKIVLEEAIIRICKNNN